MARLNTRVSSSVSREPSIYRDRTPAHETRQGTAVSPSLSPSSDKENQGQRGRASGGRSMEKRTMAPPTLPTPESDGARSNKRRRTNDGPLPLGDQDGERRIHDVRAGGDGVPGSDWYDPDEDPTVRRQNKMNIRENFRNLTDKQNDLSPEELKRVVLKANKHMSKVKQTSDATLDSALLVVASDVALRKASELAFGDSSIGVDVEEFATMCRLFMNRGGPPLDATEAEQQLVETRTQRQQHFDTDDEDEEVDDGDALRWDVLGRLACFPNNKRPAVSGFLLGPLSVHKRVRATQPRRERLQNTQTEKTRPQELQAADLERNEQSNLTHLCTNIRKVLVQTLNDRVQAADADVEVLGRVPTEEDLHSILKQRALAAPGELSYFQFVINPNSFGQTVENIFYVSFLVKEGQAEIGKDQYGLPTLSYQTPRSIEEQRQQHVSKNQAIVSMDYQSWEELVDLLDIRHPLIPHRAEEQQTQVGARGWYG